MNASNTSLTGSGLVGPPFSPYEHNTSAHSSLDRSFTGVRNSAFSPQYDSFHKTSANDVRVDVSQQHCPVDKYR